MSILAVDLAAVAWAAYLGDGGRSAFVPSEGNTEYVSIHREFSSLEHPTETEAVDGITHRFSGAALESMITSAGNDPAFMDIPEALVIEDQPHAVAWGETTKDVARMQGRIIQRMADYSCLDRLIFVQPAFWQHALGCWRKTPQETAEVARSLGYHAPDLISREEHRFKALKGTERQKVRTRLKKIETDHVDAFLIYAWTVRMKAAGELWNPHKAIQRYTR